MSARVGRRRRLQLHAEGARRAVGPRAGDVRPEVIVRPEGRNPRQPIVLSRRRTCCYDYWVNRKYHHTISAPLVYALQEALAAVEEEGLERALGASPRQPRARSSRRSRGIGLELLPPPGERLWSLNAVKVPDGVDEARVRKALLDRSRHRDRRRPRAARRQDLARRPDGIGFDQRRTSHGSSARSRRSFGAKHDRARDRGRPGRRIRLRRVHATCRCRTSGGCARRIPTRRRSCGCASGRRTRRASPSRRINAGCRTPASRRT